MREQSKEELLATIEKLKKQVEAMDDKPIVLSMEVTTTVKFEVAKEDIKCSYTFDEANAIKLKDGWRLPATEELEAMHEAKVITEGCYWSYPEDNIYLPWYYNFNTGNSFSNINKNNTYRVRAVRTIK